MFELVLIASGFAVAISALSIGAAFIAGLLTLGIIWEHKSKPELVWTPYGHQMKSTVTLMVMSFPVKTFVIANKL